MHSKGRCFSDQCEGLGMSNRLISRNVTVSGHRTSIRLERASWEGLDDICSFEGIGVNGLCTIIEALRHGSSRTSTVRAFIVTYFRKAAIENGGIPTGIVAAILPEFSRMRA